MSKTVQHKVVQQDAAQAIAGQLAALDLKSLSFIQLHRLQKVLKQAATDVADETEQRAEADASGDTVKVPSPNV
jgi:hypothetical protein